MAGTSCGLGSVRIAIVGDGPLLLACAEHARVCSLDLALVVTSDADVAAWARSTGVAVAEPAVGNGDGLVTAMRAAGVTVLLSVVNLRVLPPAVLDAVDIAINFHDGPLPDYPGLNTPSWALLAGEPLYGVTWHVMDTEIDRGAIVARTAWEIDPETTVEELNERCFAEGVATFHTVAAGLSARVVTTEPQGPATRPPFRSTTRPGSRTLIDATRPAAETARVVRALAFGERARNPLGVVRLVTASGAWIVPAARWAPNAEGTTPSIATADGGLHLTEIRALDGTPARIEDADVTPIVPRRLADALDELDGVLARHEPAWSRVLSGASAAEIPARAGTGSGWGERQVRTATAPVPFDRAVAAAGGWLGRVSGTDDVLVGVVPDQSTAERLARLAPLAVPPVVTVSDGVLGDLGPALAAAVERGPWLIDLIARTPTLAGSRPPSLVVDDGRPRDQAPGEALRLSVRPDGSIVLGFDTATVHADDASRFATQLDRMLDGAVTGTLDTVELADPRSDQAVGPRSGHDRSRTAWAEIAAGLRRSAGDTVLTDGHGRSLTGDDVLSRAEGLARALADHGVGRGARVGLAVPRGGDLVLAMLGVLASGAAYVPLDPAYPAERLALMVDDAEPAALIATPDTQVTVPPDVPILDPDAVGMARPDGPDPADAAYVIYTSGSTGRPKGVVVEHRQLVHFFAAMDGVVDRDPPGTWLAVTSPSFDISTLELLWTLARGFPVVVSPDRDAAPPDPPRDPELSVFFFASSDAGRYELLLDAARAADRLGLDAVWTPERHFHEFGGPYPNPAVTGAAVAAVTERIGIRAGSCVLPLHSPIRVAEDWAVVDRLSGGRVGVSFAAGWQPDDFVLNPGSRPGDKAKLAADLDMVRALWRGETVDMPGIDGRTVGVRTLPRPFQVELPVWLTSAGSPGTFVEAGRLGAGVLTHLLGQRPDALAANIAAYRTAWHAAGHSGEGHVTLMIHTFLGHDDGVVRELVNEPMKNYLRGSVSLLRDIASAFPTFRSGATVDDAAIARLDPAELDALLQAAADRYTAEAGLIGTVDDAARRARQLMDLGVDEFACLIDFGVPEQDALASVELLPEMRAAMRRAATEQGPVPAGHAPVAVARMARRHDVTHLQCTPSQAAMLLANPVERTVFTNLRHLLVGGEALPPELGEELRRLVPGRVTNVYGPTETTVWSLAHEIGPPVDGTVPIGRPIANTALAVLDGARRPLPAGCAGELAIAGEGVAAGYLNRPELTAERFVTVPGLGRSYLTGDVVRADPDTGVLTFLGRADGQVKLRGHRIELGEVEAVLARAPHVGRAIATVRGSGPSALLVGYVTPAATGGTVDEVDVRKQAEASLPPAMVPSTIVVLPTLPYTPNGKVDRGALPPPAAADRAAAPPVGSEETTVADVWAEVLGREVGRNENFFEAGGHSLAAVHLFSRLSEVTGDRTLSLTDVFRHPTVREFAARLGRAATGGEERGRAAVSRGDRRRAALAQRASRG